MRRGAWAAKELIGLIELMHSGFGHAAPSHLAPSLWSHGLWGQQVEAELAEHNGREWPSKLSRELEANRDAECRTVKERQSPHWQSQAWPRSCRLRRSLLCPSSCSARESR